MAANSRANIGVDLVRANEHVDPAAPARSLFQLQGGDRVHDSLAEPRVKILVARLKIGFRKINRVAHDNGDGMKMNSAPARQRFMRSEDPNGHNRRKRSRDDQPDSGLPRL